MKNSGFIPKLFTSVLIFGAVGCVALPTSGTELQEREPAQDVWKDFNRRFREACDSYIPGESLQSLRVEFQKEAEESANKRNVVWNMSTFFSDTIKWDLLIKDATKGTTFWKIKNNPRSFDSYYHVGTFNSAVSYTKSKKANEEWEEKSKQGKINLCDSWIQQSFQFWNELKASESLCTYGILYDLLKRMGTYYEDYSKQYHSFERSMKYHPEYFIHDEISFMLGDLKRDCEVFKISDCSYPHVEKINKLIPELRSCLEHQRLVYKNLTGNDYPKWNEYNLSTWEF
jgi:hypothetical protein